jgi:hypothetical protein
MNLNKLNFLKENLSIDFITLNLKNEKTKINKIINKFHYLYKFDFHLVNLDKEQKIKKSI